MSTFTKLLLAGGLALLGSRAAQAQQLLENFETTRLVDYPTLQGTLTVVANPSATAPNTSATVGKFDRNGAEQYATVAMQLKNGARFADAADYVAGTKQLSILFRHSTGATVPVQLVLQNRAKAIVPPYYPGGNFGIFNATATAAAGWQTLTFTYTAVAGGTDATVAATDVDQIAMLIAPGTNSASTYYFDDVKGPTVSTAAPVVSTDQLYDNYNGTRVIRYKKTPTTGTLNRDTLAATLLPAQANNRVLRYTRSVEQYDGLYISPVGNRLDDVTPFVNGTKRMTMRVWSPAVGTRFQITLADSTTARGNYPTGRHSEYLATSTVANAWETLVYTFSQRPDAATSNTSVNEIVLLINTDTRTKLKVYIDDWTGPHLVGYVAGTRHATDDALLASPYPNPTGTGLARLPFSLKRNASISLAVYDNLGRQVAQVIDAKPYPAGDHAADISTARLAPGLYTCRLSVDGAVLSRQLSVE